jgi:hypothetical protein
MSTDTLKGLSIVKECKCKYDVEVEKYTHRFMVEMTSTYKSMIRMRGSMHGKITSQNLPLNESECLVEPNMFEQLIFSI